MPKRARAESGLGSGTYTSMPGPALARAIPAGLRRFAASRVAASQNFVGRAGRMCASYGEKELPVQ
jgi:hypothetical protein